MMELPESTSVAKQINETLQGKRVSSVTAGHTPHKLAWYYGDRTSYAGLLTGQKIGKAAACGSMVEITAGKAKVLLGEGVGIRFHEANQPRPEKHQLLIEFEDGSALIVSVQMYGGMGCFLEGRSDP